MAEKEVRVYKGWTVVTKRGLPHCNSFATSKKDAMFMHRYLSRIHDGIELPSWEHYEAQGLRVVKSKLVIEE